MSPGDLASLKAGDEVRSSATGRIGEVKRIVAKHLYHDIEALIVDGPDKGRDIVFRSDLVEIHRKAEA